MTNRFLEEELINGLRDGNKSLFSVLFKTYYSPLTAYAATIVKEQGLAEEIVHESFIKLWENRENIHIETSLRAYLYRCIHNNCLNTLKTLVTQKKHSDKLVSEISYHAQLSTLNFKEELLEKIVSDELEVILGRVIEELPVQCREVFRLSRYEQKTYTEIAEILQVSVNTVKTQISRALEKLREAYKNI
jgi:RNA polymerase sigma-70 factor, ECF subfamily